MSYEYSLSGKWLELLKQIAPSVKRVAVLRDAAKPTGTGQFGVIQGAAPSLRVEVNPVNVREAGEIERAVVAFARPRNGGLVLTGERLRVASSRSDRHAGGPVQAAGGLSKNVTLLAAGGLVSYGPDYVDQYPARGRLR